MFAFKPNGLLTKLAMNTSPNDDEVPPVTPSFTPDGLSFKSVTNDSQSSSASSSSLPATPPSPTLPLENHMASLFVPNGLLASRKPMVTANLRVVDQNLDEDDESLPDLSQLNAVHHLRRPDTPVHIPYESSLIRGKTFEGKNLFFSRRRKRAVVTSATNAPDESIGSLLEVPLHRLLDNLAAQVPDLGVGSLALDSSPSSSISRTGRKDLWVDRYRPDRFIDLAGEERVNRETMAWVKEWDQCVFGKKKRKLKKRKRDSDEPEEEFVRVDQWGRPKEKILLISGPPGLGKTTLAHVVAKQAGYDVLEINASDARSGSVIDDRVRPALESGHAMGSTRPVLVVIDEVDGATGENSGAHSGFINKLISLTYDPPKRKSVNSSRSAKRPLLRPIVCICNDLYAPSLAKLRLHARMIRVHPSPPLQLQKRLQTICEQESLRTDKRALTLLAEICQGDLRSCLNTLQFMKTKSHGVTEAIVRSSTVGLKESETSVQSVWSDLFTPMTRKRVIHLGMTEDEGERYVSRITRSVETSGNVDKVALGVFDHYTTLHPHETTLGKFEAANEWLSRYDLLNSLSKAGQEYSLQPYLPYCITPVHSHMAATGNAKVDRPTAYWDSMTRAKAGEEILLNMSKSILHPEGGRQQQVLAGSANYRHLLGREILRTEFVPLLNRIISPPIRPINKQIIRAEEKAVLSRLVDVMVSTGLHFDQDKTEDGQLLYRLEPAIDTFIVYDGKRATDIPAARYAVRHMIAGEIEAETASRRSEVIEKHLSAANVRLAKALKGGDTNVDIADKPPVDFFGRPMVFPIPPVEPDVREAKKARFEFPMPTKPFSVLYRYHEGNSAAVRKPTKMTTFL